MGLSYTKVEEEETERAERQIRSQRDSELIPSNCYYGVFPQFVWDNNALEECTALDQGRLTVQMGL